MLREKTNLREKNWKRRLEAPVTPGKNGKKDWRPGQTPQKFAREVVFFFCRVFSEKCQNPKAQLPPKNKTQKLDNFPQKKQQRTHTHKKKKHNVSA